MKNYFIIVLAAIILTGCGSFGFNVAGVMSGQKIGDNGAIAFNDERVEISPDGEIFADITTAGILEIQQGTEGTADVFRAYMQMWIEIVKEHAGVYKSIWKKNTGE